jgi:hypothetical protein
MLVLSPATVGRGWLARALANSVRRALLVAVIRVSMDIFNV